MKKLQKVLHDIQDEENFIKRNSLTVNDYHEFMRICSALSRGENDTTINAKVKGLCDKYNFGTLTEGIGWRIALNRRPKRIIGDNFTEVKR